MNWLCFVILTIIPIIFSITLNLLDKNISVEMLIDDCKYFIKFIIKLMLALFLIFFIQKVIYTNEGGEGLPVRLMIFRILYYLIMISLIIMINYFSTRNMNFRLCIKTFLNEITQFLQSHFALNLIIILLILFTTGELSIGLIGSYTFFILSETYKKYKEKDIYVKTYEKKHKFFQTLLNVSMLLSFVTIEKLINCLFNNSIMEITYYDVSSFLIFNLFIALNCMMSKIYYFNVKEKIRK